MSNTDLPLMPSLERSDPEVCNVVHLYLAILHELPAEQVRALTAHLQLCPSCAREYRLMKQATRVIARLDSSTPSSRVDQAVMAEIARRCNVNIKGIAKPLRLPPPPPRKPVYRRMSRTVATLLAVAAVILLAISGFLYNNMLLPQQSFALPANLSWNAYVLYYTQTQMSDQGEPQTVVAYHSLGNDSMNVETKTGAGKLDVVMVADAAHNAIAMDMMHRVIESGAESWKWDTDKWTSNKWMFDLTKLRSDIQAKRAVYLEKGTFQGQSVYQIRYPNGDVLLLDMSYKPVNVLHGGMTGKPVYDDKLQWLLPTQVPQGVWEMTPPAGFTPGNMP